MADMRTCRYANEQHMAKERVIMRNTTKQMYNIGLVPRCMRAVINAWVLPK